eukprot:TRINITY_DN5745_c0_g1_i1.p1 TRINITY_DN5745_c0_g1~~TRINITY_DN5745_c0_g1_i1.p1  ORF type:complete len:146 (-),score=21.11 TRINITY_DN5745_c0_g1_i1:24-461(-)
MVGRSKMPWFQKTISVAALPRGCHLVTDKILKQIPEITNFKVGLAHLFIQHTSASLTINENYDSDVRKDLEDVLNRVVPEKADYRHTIEGPDDMPAHAKATFIGSSVTIPVTNGKLNLGTWQGIYLCEHRDRASSRSIVVTIQGE